FGWLSGLYLRTAQQFLYVREICKIPRVNPAGTQTIMSRAPRCWHLISNRWNSAITEYALNAARALSLKGADNLFSPLAGSPAEERAREYDLRVATFARFDPMSVPF